jgi:hypothetical protein
MIDVGQRATWPKVSCLAHLPAALTQNAQLDPHDREPAQVRLGSPSPTPLTALPQSRTGSGAWAAAGPGHDSGQPTARQSLQPARRHRSYLSLRIRERPGHWPAPSSTSTPPQSRTADFARHRRQHVNPDGIRRGFQNGQDDEGEEQGAAEGADPEAWLCAELGRQSGLQLRTKRRSDGPGHSRLAAGRVAQLPADDGRGRVERRLASWLIAWYRNAHRTPCENH